MPLKIQLVKNCDQDTSSGTNELKLCFYSGPCLYLKDYFLALSVRSTTGVVPDVIGLALEVEGEVEFSLGVGTTLVGWIRRGVMGLAAVVATGALFPTAASLG